MKKSSFLSVGFLLIFPLTALCQEWRDVAPGDFVQLPARLYFQSNYRIQWWYFTGHLNDEAGREFGYELTFFAVGVQKRKYVSKFGAEIVYISNFAVTDVGANKFYHFSDTDVGAYGFAGADGKRLRVWVEKDYLEGTMDRMHIVASANGAGIDLILIPEKPLVLNGDRGYSRKSEESALIASLYFSCTNLETQGTLKIGDTYLNVKGKSWFDREISSRGLAKDEQGWDWFALQLDDGREILLYDIRKKDGSIDRFSSGTIIYKTGAYRHLTKDDFTVKVLDHYTSEHTAARYPARWEIIIPSENLRLTIAPMTVDQEFRASNIMGTSYWEGACRIDGNAQGRAYVEMTGY